MLQAEQDNFEIPELADGFEKVLVAPSALKNTVDSLKRCHLALKQAQRIFTAGAQALTDEADVIGQCKAALELLL